STSIEAGAVDADGRPTASPGPGAADGSYTIAGVPGGSTYALKWSDPDLVGGTYERYIVTSKRKLDLGLVFYGRPDATLVTTSPTNLEFNVSGLAPWQAVVRLTLPQLGA